MHKLIKIITLSASIFSAANAHAKETETIVVAGGCFWGVEAVFEHTKGVIEAVSGYAGGEASTAKYYLVSGGKTGHAESVKITYDPEEITLNELLDIYFNVAHNPTELNFQGPDHGTQYRSTVFYNSDEQKKFVEEKIAELKFSEPIVTTLEPLKKFYPAEDYHQNYVAAHPDQAYIINNDLPKLKKLKEFWDVYDPTGYGEGFAIGIAAKTSGLKIYATNLKELSETFNHFTSKQKKFLWMEDEEGDFLKVLNKKGLPLIVAFASTGEPDEAAKYEYELTVSRDLEAREKLKTKLTIIQPDAASFKTAINYDEIQLVSSEKGKEFIKRLMAIQ